MRLIAFVLAAAFVSSPAWAEDAHHAHASDTTSAATGGFAANEGEIRKVDKEQGKLTIKHGPLPEVDMSGMTMVFRVKDPAMLDQVAAGDQVKLRVEKVNGILTVTQLERKN